MSSKLLDSISRKLQPNEVLIDVFPVAYFRGDKRKEDTLAITSLSFHFLTNNSLKKTVPVRDIRVITLSTFSQQLVLHCQEEDIRLESPQTVKLLQNLLRIRQKINNDPSPLPVMLQKEKSLARFVSEDTKRSHFWSGLFGRKEPSESKWRWSDRRSYCQIEVTQRNFALEIGRKMYASNYVNVELLYLSGALGFIFNELEYAKEQVQQDDYLLTNANTGEKLMLRKVVKREEQQVKKLRRYLQGFRWEDFKQQIYYAVETNRHFEIVTPVEKGQRIIEAMLEEDRFISEIDLVSIFYKLMAFAQSCNLVLHSLSPAQILVSDNILIDSFFCIIPHTANPHYLAPEQLHPSLPSAVQLINFWKIGMLLYEIAFTSLPFPIEYLAHTVLSQGKFTLRFPPDSKRSSSFKNFLGEILKVEPGKRGGGADWKTRVFFEVYRFSIISGQEKA